jgi:hypothetical protein
MTPREMQFPALMWKFNHLACEAIFSHKGQAVGRLAC